MGYGDYNRVIPRDLFNESKLLKCLGQLALHLHNYEGRWPISLEHDDGANAGFYVVQDPDDGGLWCENLHLIHRDGRETRLKSIYNSKNPYPLVYSDDKGAEGIYVFGDDGTFSEEFKAAILD